MRFLLSRQAERVARSRRTASVQQARHGPSQHQNVVIPLAERKWGQNCGESCSCVLRFEVGLDNEERIVAVNYKAKRLVPTHATQATTTTSANGGAQYTMYRSKRSGKVQLSSCSCETLHSLAQQTCQFSMGKTAAQVQNNLFSSPAIRRQCLAAGGAQKGTGANGCYDLVHSTLTATFEGYIPARASSTTVEQHIYLDDYNRRQSMDVEDDEETGPAPIVEPSTAVLWWDKTSRLDSQTPSLFDSSAAAAAAAVLPSDSVESLKPVDWLAYIDQMEEESA